MRQPPGLRLDLATREVVTQVELFHRKRELIEAIVETGKAQGDLRSDLTADDVVTFVAMVTTASVALDQPPELRRRYLSLMLDALNPPGAETLP